MELQKLFSGDKATAYAVMRYQEWRRVARTDGSTFLPSDLAGCFVQAKQLTRAFMVIPWEQYRVLQNDRTDSKGRAPARDWCCQQKFAIAAAMLSLGIAGAATNNITSTSDADIAKKLTHEIRMYPRYGIFDSVNFSVKEGRVDLFGEVSQPYKKADLGRIAQHVPAVASLTNEIKVLPLSPMDNRLRQQRNVPDRTLERASSQM